MFPLNDTEANRYTSFPYMTIFLILLNIVISFFVADNGQIYAMYGTIPKMVWQQEGGNAVTAVTYMFLHGGMFHLVGNMLSLWVFGRRVEDVTGPWRFLAFYLVCGLTANILSSIVRADSEIPTIGASGALYGVMAAYLMLFPKGRIRVLFLLWLLPVFNNEVFNGLWVFGSIAIMGGYVAISDKNLIQSLVTLYFPTPKAYLVILYYVLLEIPRGLEILVYDYGTSSVAHWAHLGGFFGGLFIFFFLRSDAFHRYRNELPL